MNSQKHTMSMLDSELKLNDRMRANAIAAHQRKVWKGDPKLIRKSHEARLDAWTKDEHTDAFDKIQLYPLLYSPDAIKEVMSLKKRLSQKGK